MGMTLDEKYYKINENLNRYLQTNYGLEVPIYKYGFDIATLKSSAKKSEKIYPFAVSTKRTLFVNPWSTKESGHYTRFEYQLNYYTSPKTEFTNDAELYKPFECIKLALTDISLSVLQDINEETGDIHMLADILKIRTTPGYNVVSGAIVPSMVLIAEMAAICSYPVNVADPGFATDTSGILEFDFII